MEGNERGKAEPLGWAAKAWIQLSAIRSESPLIQCITNFVSMDLMANTLLSAGASPAMIHNVEEIPDFTPHAHALCINVGTLSPDWLSGMKLAAKFASDSGKPWVLDPVAAGASGFRLKSCLELVELKPTVIRGNASEVLALSKASLGPTKVKQTNMNLFPVRVLFSVGLSCFNYKDNEF
jgi:hydroxyethylthiazole kinase